MPLNVIYLCLVIRMSGAPIWEEVSAKFLAIIIDSSLKFDYDVKMICKKIPPKRTGIARMSNFMFKIKKIVLIPTFFERLLIWMFSSTTLYHRINRLHERALRIAYEDSSSDFEEDTILVHKRN